jgi:hypothetical protein
MPLWIARDDVFIGEQSFAPWHEALDLYEILPVHKNSPPDMARRAQRAVCPDAGVPDGREDIVPSE